MRSKNKIIVLIIVIIVLVCVFLSKNSSNSSGDDFQSYTLESIPPTDATFRSEMSIAVVVCGNRSQETMMMIKSALLLTKGHLHFYIFADDQASLTLRNRLEEWQLTVNRSYAFEIRSVEFPSGEYNLQWKKLFKPCASQRLFLPSLLPEVDSVLYVDTDTLFLGPVEQVWAHFSKMNQSQIAALSPEHEDPKIGWYNRFARHPYYKPQGVNTGVMLMNLTRMRAFGWGSYIEPIYKKFKTSIPWGDQDIINIIFSFHPDKLYVYGCNYNFRADLCMYSSVCKAAEEEGVIVLHGSRGIFHNDKHPPFRIICQAIQKYDWASDSFTPFLTGVKQQLNSVSPTQCGSIARAFYKNLEKYDSTDIKRSIKRAARNQFFEHREFYNFSEKFVIGT